MDGSGPNRAYNAVAGLPRCIVAMRYRCLCGTRQFTARRATLMLLIMLLFTGWETYRDQFADECTHNRGQVIEHRGNLYCISGSTVLEWVLR